MSVYLGNTFIGNGNYLGNQNIPDAGIFVPPPEIRLSTTNLIAYYSQDSYDSSTGIWYDISGYGNNATVNGTALTSTSTKGLSFNGTDNWITLPTFSGSAALTIILWGDVNYSFPNRDSSYLQSLFNKRIGSNNGFASFHTYRQTATRDMLTTIGQSGTGTNQQGFRGAQTGSVNFIGYQSTNLTTSVLNTGFANAVTSQWSGSDGVEPGIGWYGVATTGSVMFPYNQSLIFGSGSSAGTPTIYKGTVSIIAIYDSMLSNDTMNSQYLLVSSSTTY
jgi:hypothetical protein